MPLFFYPNPNFTMDDLHIRLHNKPSPFKQNNSEKRLNIPNHELASAATNAISNFLLLTLPFTEYLSDIQSRVHNFHPFIHKRLEEEFKAVLNHILPLPRGKGQLEGKGKF
jgi:hypothetical protein